MGTDVSPWYSVPFGFVRWNLSTIAPLVWWQLAMSTALGTIFALPFLLAMANPAVNYRVSFPILARVSFGVRGADFQDITRHIIHRISNPGSLSQVPSV
jgi:cytosine/uracil/thiamine/allantoin permease